MGRPKMTGYEAHLHKVLYGRWGNMIDRCQRPKNPAYKNYGGRGISVCIEWLNFKEFEKWALSNGFEPRLTLDRIDADGDYCPENCRWVTMQEQAHNKRDTVYAVVDGEKISVAAYARKMGADPNLVSSRVKRGWDLQKAVSKPPHRAVGIQRAKKGE